MVPTGRCHPLMSRPLAPSDRRTRVIRANSSVRPTGTDEGRIETLNRERPHFRRFASQYGGSLPAQLRRTIASAPNAIESDALTVLGGVKGAFAALTGSAALDPACARHRRAFIDGVISFVRRHERS